MRIQIPTGLTETMAQLAHAVRTCTLTPYLKAFSLPFHRQIQECTGLLSSFFEDYKQVELGWHLALAARNARITELSHQVRDFWILLRLRDKRSLNPGLLLIDCRVPRTAPTHASPEIWIQHGRNLVQAKEAIRQTHDPALSPQLIEDLAHRLHDAIDAQALYHDRFLELKKATEQLRSQQKLGNQMLRRLANRLRELSYGQSAHAQRQLLIQFGFRFVASPSAEKRRKAEMNRVHEDGTDRAGASKVEAAHEENTEEPQDFAATAQSTSPARPEPPSPAAAAPWPPKQQATGLAAFTRFIRQFWHPHLPQVPANGTYAAGGMTL